MDAYTSKPIDAEELFAAIESYVPRPPAATDSPLPAAPPCAVPAPHEAAVAANGSPPPPTKGTWCPSMIDWSLARKAVRGDECLLDTIVETALGEIPQLLAEIRRAAGAGDARALRLAAHTLKGSIRYFGAQPVFEPAVRLEAMGQDGRLEGAGEVVSVLDRSAAELMTALAEHILTANRAATGREGGKEGGATPRATRGLPCLPSHRGCPPPALRRIPHAMGNRRRNSHGRCRPPALRRPPR